MAAERDGKVRSSVALLILAIAASAAYGLDQLTKALVEANLTEGEVVPVLGALLQWQFVRNPGAAFSLASGMTWIFTILAAVVITFIVWFSRRIRSVAWAVMFGLLLGGVLGNLTDRLFREPGFGVGHVVDFIATPWLLPAIYNIADIAIVSSMVLFLFLTLRGVGLDGRRQTDDGDAAATPGDAGDAAADAETGTETHVYRGSAPDVDNPGAGRRDEGPGRAASAAARPVQDA